MFFFEIDRQMSRNLFAFFFEENLLEICFLQFLCLTDFYSGKGASKKSAKSFLVDLSRLSHF